jgi:heme exporter protein D
MIFSLQFESLQELFWMNGHGPYVWSAYGIVLVALIYLVWSPLARRKQFVRAMRAAQRRQASAMDDKTS